MGIMKPVINKMEREAMEVVVARRAAAVARGANRAAGGAIPRRTTAHLSPEYRGVPSTARRSVPRSVSVPRSTRPVARAYSTPSGRNLGPRVTASTRARTTARPRVRPVARTRPMAAVPGVPAVRGASAPSRVRQFAAKHGKHIAAGIVAAGVGGAVMRNTGSPTDRTQGRPTGMYQY